MGRKDNFDVEMEGQMTIDDLFSPPEKMIAVSNIFARARKQMSLAEQKTFVLALTHIEWTKSPEEQCPIVYLDKKTLEKILGYESDSTDASQHLWRAIKDLDIHSHIEIVDRDRGLYNSGVVVSSITMSKNTDYVRLRFQDEFFPLFTGLGREYCTLWSSDIFAMQSKRGIQFYELLRQKCFDLYEAGNNLYSYGMGVKAIKEMFDIPKEGKGSYVRGNGKFDRPGFEKYVIGPLCDDLLKCKMIQLVIQPDGKPYEKVKRGGRVEGYRFYWSLSAHPAVADAGEVKQIQDRVDRDPQVLKVAKDILEGEKKPRRKKSGNPFNDYPQTTYDFEALEKKLIRNH